MHPGIRNKQTQAAFTTTARHIQQLGGALPVSYHDLKMNQAAPLETQLLVAVELLAELSRLLAEAAGAREASR